MLSPFHDEAEIVIIKESLLVLDYVGVTDSGEHSDLIQAVVSFR